MNKFTKIISLSILTLSGVGFVALKNSGSSTQVAKAYTSPSTYYSTVNGTGSSLLSSINNKIKLSSWIGYNGLKAAYATTDVRNDGKLYDIYSDATNYIPGSAFAENYSKPGDGYNREHTIPKSWWGDGTSKQGCDIYIVIPSDAKINGVRSNFPYGITTSGESWKLAGDTYENRYGTSTDTSYVSGKVFEPFDNRKGDLARIYFYAVAAYLTSGESNGAVTKWTSGDGSKVFSASGNNGFVQKYLNMLLKWHHDDPVSQWEITRNNNGENKQGNRNPFVDHPSWVDLIWGGTYPSNGTNYENTNGGTATVVNGQISGGSTPSTDPSASISPSSTSVQVGNTINLTATLSNVSNANNITWTSSNNKATVSKGTTSTTSSIATVTGVEAGNVTIYCKYSGTTIGSATVTVTNSGGGGNSTITITDTDLPTSYPASASSLKKEGYNFGFEKLANYGNGMQFQASNGKIYNTDSLGNISSVSITEQADKAHTNLKIGFGSTQNAASSAANNGTALSTSGVNGNNNAYFCIINGSGAAYISSLIIAYTPSTAPSEPTSISASVNKTYYIGETISTSDISVKDNNDNDITDFTFDDDNYQFTYADANENGVLTEKEFSEAITYGSLKCDLVVSVRRKAYVAPVSIKDTITASDLTATDTGYTNFSNVSKTSPAKYAGNSAKNNGNIQMRSSNSNSGLVSTSSGGNVKSVKITVGSGTNTINVYGKNTAYSAASDLYSGSTQGTLVGSLSSTGTVTFTTPFTYVGIRSNNNAIYISSIEITYGTSETPENIANYIMYADADNQCSTGGKFANAKSYFENLSKVDRVTFMTSEDYVISTARTRLLAWAAHEGKIITLTNGDYVIALNSSVSLIAKKNNETTSILIIVISLTSITALGGFLFIKQKKE